MYSALKHSRFSQLLGQLFSNPYVSLTLLLIVYFGLNCWMTFTARYDQYLFSDMYGYFNRAIQIYNGDDKSIGAWVGFAPYYSRLLAYLYSALKVFDLESIFLQAVLVQNMLMSVVSGVALFEILKRVTGKSVLGLVLTGLYLFSYPHLYFNGFVLTEPFAVPLIIISVWLMMAWRCSYKVILSGVTLAVAVGIRPSNGLLGLTFALYIAFAGVPFPLNNFKSWVIKVFPQCVKAALFSVAFFVSIFFVVTENNRISDGRMKGLTSHSGYNFLLGQSQAHRIFSTWDGITYVFVPASVAHHPELGTLRSPIPIYDSERFYAEGWKILDAYPNLWLEHFTKYKYLFFDNLFPAVPDHPGFIPLMEVFRYIVFYMFLACGLVYITVRERDAPVSAVLFFSGGFLLPAASLYLFTATHKYFFNFSYTIYVLFVLGAYSAIKHRKKYRKFLLTFFSCVALGTVAFWGHYFWNIKFIDQNVWVKLEQSDKPVTRLDQNVNVVETKEFPVDQLVFFEHDNLKHATLGHLDHFRDYFITATTKLIVEKEGTYTFSFFVDDGYEVFLNDNRIVRVKGPTRMADNNIKRSVVLNPGEHVLRIRMYQRDGLSGLAGYYIREDQRPKHEGLVWEPKNGRGTAIGLDSEFTRFEAVPPSLDNEAKSP